MAANAPAVSAAPPRSRSRRATSARRIALPVRALETFLCLACLIAGLYLVGGYPFARGVVAALFIAWTVFAAWRPSFALPALIALVPAVGLAPFTGWLTFEETDLFVLATAAGGYAARVLASTRPGDDPRDAPRLSIFSVVLLGLFLASTMISLERGIASAGGWRFDFFGGYNDPQNSLRIFKSFAFACLTAPLVVAELRRPGGLDRLGLAFTTGLGLCGLAVLQERFAFTGLLDFSDDYRVTAPFWEMHVGGAALDGFLALTIPFAVREAVRRTERARFVGALVVLALAGYASLVTFSRAVYGAVPFMLVVLALLVMRQRLHIDRRRGWAVVAKGLLLTIAIGVAAFFVFRTGGYRALTAFFGLFCVALPAESALRRLTLPALATAIVLAVLASGAGWAAGAIFAHGPYVVYALAAVAACWAIWRDDRGPTKSVSMVLVAAWLWLAFEAVVVAARWGGAVARDDAFVVVAIVVLATLGASRARESVWPSGRRERLATIGFAGLVLAAMAVFMAGAYMGGRFAGSRSDLDLRLSHWTQGIARLHGTDWLLGKGLGRFPASSLFESTDGTTPGTMHVVDRPGDHHLVMGGTQTPYLEFEELYRLTQLVDVRPHTKYSLLVRARAAADARVHLEVCERQLLYRADCRISDLKIVGDAGWQDLVYRFDSGEVGRQGGLATRPVYLSIASWQPVPLVDVESVHLIGPDGRDLIANGDFADRTARWFTTSNRFHLPWHIKNIVLDVLFDQGALGLALFALVVGGAWLRTAVGRAYRHPDAPYVAAAIAGYVAVGATDSLLDVPRVAFLFDTVVVIGLALRNPRIPSRPGIHTAAPPVAASATADAASARAARRRNAFGSRRPSSPG